MGCVGAKAPTHPITFIDAHAVPMRLEELGAVVRKRFIIISKSLRYKTKNVVCN